ncbi:MAG: hypothetical protein R3C24_15600 [Cyanobacteriota/Melainabacteria group bacterium]
MRFEDSNTVAFMEAPPMPAKSRIAVMLVNIANEFTVLPVSFYAIHEVIVALAGLQGAIGGRRWSGLS